MNRPNPTMWRDDDGDVMIATQDGHVIRFLAPITDFDDLLESGRYVLFERVYLDGDEPTEIDVRSLPRPQ